MTYDNSAPESLPDTHRSSVRGEGTHRCGVPTLLWTVLACSLLAVPMLTPSSRSAAQSKNQIVPQLTTNVLGEGAGLHNNGSLLVHEHVSAVASRHSVDSSSQHLDFRCVHPQAPADGGCLLRERSDGRTVPASHDRAAPCVVTYHRVTQRACGLPPSQTDTDMLVAPKASRGKPLCPCHRKHAALVEHVVMAAMTTTDGRITKIAALSNTLWRRDVQHSLGQLGRGPSAERGWALVDGGSYRDSSMHCLSGGVATAIAAGEVSQIFDALQHHHRAHLKAAGGPHVVGSSTTLHSLSPAAAGPSSSSTAETMQQPATPRLSERCDELRRHPLAVLSNVTPMRHGAWRTESVSVFYALDALMSAPGHALELITNGIGVYYRDELDKKSVAWLVPCRESGIIEEGLAGGRAAQQLWLSPLYWTKFFLELNEVLQMPFYPLSVGDIAVSTHTPAADLAASPPLLQFARVYFAPYYFMGWNQACFKRTLFERLWPAAASHGASNTSGSAPSSAPVYRIGLLKLSAVMSRRSFSATTRFLHLLASHGVVQLSTSLPLVERMRHLNIAELIVTTWGSTMTTATGLMLPTSLLGSATSGEEAPRSSNASSVRGPAGGGYPQSHQQRMLVLIHPGYCHEAHALFRMSAAKVCELIKDRRRPRMSRMHRRSISILNGALADFDGGEHFCVKFLLAATLDVVQSKDFTFSCA